MQTCERVQVTQLEIFNVEILHIMVLKIQSSSLMGSMQLHPIGNDKAPTFLGMAVIKGYSQMLLSDITRVKGYRRSQFKAWLTRRSDDPLF